jgi:hypothetical protein
MGFHNLVNTAQFSYTARDYKKQGDRYCTAPVGSKDWVDFWAEEERRCREGYKVADLWIPGRHYFYLNYTPIWKVPDDVAMKAYREARQGGKVGKLTSERIFGFPRFYEIDYEWYRFKHIAWYGGEFMGVKSPGAKHISCGKARGAGFSYKEASDGVYNYTFIDGSKSYYFAGLEQYLTTDGILNKVQPMLDFINDNCLEWKKNRQKKNTLMHQRASYIDAFGVERGSFSEIMGVVVDDPDKTRGKRGRKIVFEEAGSFRNLKKALNVCKGSIKDGDIYVGQISLFGTGGEEGPDIEGLEDIFYDPDTFDMLAFPNIWEEGFEGTSCGYFVPVWRTKSTHMDSEGNVDVAAALASEIKIRKQKKKAKDPKVLDGHKAEYPFKPSEMFNRHTQNPFDVAEIDAQIRRIESQAAIQGMLRHGKLIRSEEFGVEFVPQKKDEAVPVEQYPHSHTDNLEGCITIVSRPYKDQKGKVPEGLYQITVDPYYKEESADLTSLFAVYVWKQYNQIDPVDEGLPVAWFVGRPQKLETAYKNLFMLSDYYNCTIQSEIAGGGQGIVDYAKMTKQLHKLEYEPDMLNNKEYASAASQKNRSLFMNMPTEKKRLGLTYLINWHTQQRGVTEEGNPILNIHRIYDVGLLREMKKYNGERNADRISQAIVAMFMLKANAYREEIRIVGERNFFKRDLFGGGDGMGASQTAGYTSFY